MEKSYALPFQVRGNVHQITLMATVFHRSRLRGVNASATFDGILYV
ncbi:hypothetical protein [uncultured Acetobacteroides sp.]|nr:hypothetical protein [uncultured Acetobacteroides sp.]